MIIRTESVSPISVFMTDWRGTNTVGADFGLARPTAFHHLSEDITRCIAQVYPPRTAAPDSDEGCDFVITYEKSLARTLMEDIL
jgi:hypothetical protein